jgi:hypothetical protein
MAYLRVEKPHFLFLEGSAGAEATTDVATVALSDASAARTGTSAACVASSVDRPAAGGFRARSRRLLLCRLRGSR